MRNILDVPSVSMSFLQSTLPTKSAATTQVGRVNQAGSKTVDETVDETVDISETFSYFYHQIDKTNYEQISIKVR
jgi:hypothetical protein